MPILFPIRFLNDHVVPRISLWDLLVILTKDDLQSMIDCYGDGHQEADPTLACLCANCAPQLVDLMPIRDTRVLYALNGQEGIDRAITETLQRLVSHSTKHVVLSTTIEPAFPDLCPNFNLFAASFGFANKAHQKEFDHATK